MNTTKTLLLAGFTVLSFAAGAMAQEGPIPFYNPAQSVVTGQPAGTASNTVAGLTQKAAPQAGASDQPGMFYLVPRVGGIDGISAGGG